MLWWQIPSKHKQSYWICKTLGFPRQKTRPLIGRPDRSANQRPVFLAGNHSDLKKKLTLVMYLYLLLQDCGYDYIEVFSGYDDAGPSYGRFCGNKVRIQKKSIYYKTSLIFVFLHLQIPPEIVSVDAALLLRFKSDDTINAKGFSAAYVITIFSIFFH